MQTEKVHFTKDGDDNYSDFRHLDRGVESDILR